MRIYLKGALRRRFDLAWEIVPKDVRKRLAVHITSVRSFEAGENYQVRWRSGEIVESLQPKSAAWFITDPTDEPPRFWIFINSVFADESEIFAVVTFLHELAHAYEYTLDYQEAGIRLSDRSETAGWLQAACWLALDQSGYQQAGPATLLSLSLARDELHKWCFSSTSPD